MTDRHKIMDEKNPSYVYWDSGYRDTFVAASVPNKANYAFKAKQNRHLIAGITMDKFSHDAYGGKGSDTPHLLRDLGNNLTIALAVDL